MLNAKFLFILSTTFFSLSTYGQTFRTYKHKTVKVFYYSDEESTYKFNIVTDEIGNFVIREDQGEYTNYKRWFTILSNKNETIKNKQWYSVLSDEGIVKDKNGKTIRKSTTWDAIAKKEVTIYETFDNSDFSIVNMTDNIIISYFNE